MPQIVMATTTYHHTAMPALHPSSLSDALKIRFLGLEYSDMKLRWEKCAFKIEGLGDNMVALTDKKNIVGVYSEAHMLDGQYCILVGKPFMLRWLADPTMKTRRLDILPHGRPLPDQYVRVNIKMFHLSASQIKAFFLAQCTRNIDVYDFAMYYLWRDGQMELPGCLHLELPAEKGKDGGDGDAK